MGNLNTYNLREDMEETKCSSSLGFLLVVIGLLFLNESVSRDTQEMTSMLSQALCQVHQTFMNVTG